jgi:hypothetical protein
MTIASGQKSQLSKAKEIDFKNEADGGSLKRNRKSIARSRKYFNDRMNNTASIYKKSSLNIAHFLSTYTTQVVPNKGGKKRRKSGRSTSNSNYKNNYKKINERSQSNKRSESLQKSRASIIPQHSSDNLVNINISGTHVHASNLVNEKRDSIYNLNANQNSTDNNRTKYTSNRGEIPSTSSNSLRANKNSKSGTITSKTLQFDVNDDEAERLNKLETHLKAQIKELDSKIMDEEPDEKDFNGINQTKIYLISESLIDFTQEFPKFSSFLNCVKNFYDKAIKDLVLKEKAKTEQLLQNFSKMKTKLESETSSKSKLSDNLKALESKNKTLKQDLDSLLTK